MSLDIMHICFNQGFIIIGAIREFGFAGSTIFVFILVIMVAVLIALLGAMHFLMSYSAFEKIHLYHSRSGQQKQLKFIVNLNSTTGFGYQP